MSKPLHEETIQERDARHAAEIAAASAPPPLTKEQKLQLEREHIASQEWALTEKRYDGSTEASAKVWAALQQLKLPCTFEGLASAFEWCLKNNLLTAKEPDPRAPKTILEHAASYGYTRAKIVATPKDRLRTIYNDPANDYFHRRMIDAVLAEGK